MSEQEGYEFRYYAFEDMEPIKCEVQEIKTTQPSDPIPLPQEEIRLPLSDEKLQALQVEDKFCKDISNKLQQEQEPVLYRKWDIKMICRGWKTEI